MHTFSKIVGTTSKF